MIRRQSHRQTARRHRFLPGLLLPFLAFPLCSLTIPPPLGETVTIPPGPGTGIPLPPNAPVSNLLLDQARVLGDLVDFSKPAVVGFWWVVGALALFLLFAMLNPLRSKGSHICVYRPYEKKLLDQGILDQRLLTDYHAQYHWGDYASVCMGGVLVAVTMLAIDGQKMRPEQVKIQSVSVCVMTVAAILLTWADLVHTNTQTPIVPRDRRFKLIDLSLNLGTIGTMLMIAAILFFVAIISKIAAIISSITYVVVMILVFQRRRISKRELFAQYHLTEIEGFEGDEKYFPSPNDAD